MKKILDVPMPSPVAAQYLAMRSLMEGKTVGQILLDMAEKEATPYISKLDNKQSDRTNHVLKSHNKVSSRMEKLHKISRPSSLDIKEHQSVKSSHGSFRKTSFRKKY